MNNQALVAVIHRCRGQNRTLLAELENLSPEAQRELHSIVRTLIDEKTDAERSFRPFPGGPRRRM